MHLTCLLSLPSDIAFDLPYICMLQAHKISYFARGHFKCRTIYFDLCMQSQLSQASTKKLNQNRN